jgi:hypothetical protein
MNEVEIITQEVTFKDSESGEVLLTAPLMDLYYTIALKSAEDPKLSNIDKSKAAALEVNSTYGCSLTWGQVANLLEKLDPMVNKVKKN